MELVRADFFNHYCFILLIIGGMKGELKDCWLALVYPFQRGRKTGFEVTDQVVDKMIESKSYIVKCFVTF